MRITRLERKRGRRGRVIMHVDGEPRLETAADVLRDAGLRAGDDITASDLEGLARADLRHRAREAALRLLAVRSRSHAELRRRLLSRGVPESVVEETLDNLSTSGLVDDEAFARSFVRDRVRLRPRGRGGLVGELRARGIARDAAEEAVHDVFEQEELSEASLALTAARGWARRAPEPLVREARAGDPEALERARRRLYGYLGRRGFPAGVVRQVVDDVLAGD